MNEDTFYVILSTIFGGMAPFLTVVGISWAIKGVNKKTLRPLLDNFQTNQPKPGSTIRVSQFRFGNGVPMNNTVSIAENSDQLYFKAILTPACSIPLSEIKEVELQKGYFGRETVKLSFKKDGIPSMSLSLRASSLSQMPRLMSMAGQKLEAGAFSPVKSSGHGSIHGSTQGSIQSLGNQVRLDHQSKMQSQGNSMMSQGNTSGLVRAAFLIMAIASGLIVTFYFLSMKYGIGLAMWAQKIL